MFAYTIRRLLAAIPILIAATFIVFWLVSLTVDPVTEEFAGLNPPPPQQTIDLERHRLNLDQGFFVQYFDWLRNLVTHGTFGPALNPATDINSELYHRLGVTMRLYSPLPAVLDGTWTPPALHRVDAPSSRPGSAR